MTRAALRVPVLIFVGTLLMQAAWILALPPFRGSDEFDHAFRAASVARGQWNPEKVAAERGRGDLVVVPRDFVEAATPVCEMYEYTGRDNCHPVEDLGDGMVTVASAATHYHPAFYWVIGKPAQPFDGATALYAMRIMAAILCAGFIALAGWATSLWARTRWPLVALVVAMTPVVVYSTGVAAPNGIEMCAALAVWMTLLGLSKPDLSPGVQRALLWSSVPGAVVLTTVRPTGPLWLGLIVLSVAALVGTRGTLAIMLRHRGTAGSVAGIVATATVASVWWIMGAGSAQLEGEADLPDPVRHSLIQIPVWLLQSIAAFPLRNNQAPAVVYAAVLVVLATIVGGGLWVARRRVRIAIAVIMLIAVAVPFTATVLTYSQTGAIWQGRYGLPFASGVMLLAGLALEECRFRHRLAKPALLAGWLCLVVAHAVGVTHVLVGERLNSPLAGDPTWLMPQAWILVLLTVLGLLAWAAAVGWFHRSIPESKSELSRHSRQVSHV